MSMQTPRTLRTPRTPIRTTSFALGSLLVALASACSDAAAPVAAAGGARLERGASSGTSGGTSGGTLSGGKACGTFAITLADGRVISGKQSASLAGVGGTATVQGTYVQFAVDLGTFKVTNYTLGGTTIFARKEPLHGQTLTQPLRVDLNNEQLVLQRTSTNGTLDMKIQAKDCNTGGLFQMEAESRVAAATTYEHELATGFSYFDPNPSTSRTFFSIGGTATGAFLGYDSPETATRIAPTPGEPVSGTVARYSVLNGGRMGMVVGEDAREGLATP